MKRVGLKIDVLTHRGVYQGIPKILSLLKDFGYSCTFFLNLGPDYTGSLLIEFLKNQGLTKDNLGKSIKAFGSSVFFFNMLGVRPSLEKTFKNFLGSLELMGHEVGIYGFDSNYWEKSIQTLSEPSVRYEINKGQESYKRIFGRYAQSTTAPGCNINRSTLAAFDDYALSYASATWGQRPFYPVVGQRVFRTLQLPVTLPSLKDSEAKKTNSSLEDIKDFYLQSILDADYSVMNISAELEGCAYVDWLEELLHTLSNNQIKFCSLREIAHNYHEKKSQVPVLTLENKVLNDTKKIVTFHQGFDEIKFEKR